MNLGEMFNLVKYVANKDFDGNVVTPTRFKELLPIVNIDLFRQKYGLPEEYQPGRPIPLEYVDITLKNTDDLKAFKVSLLNAPVVNGVLLWPADYAHRNTISYRYIKAINGVSTLLPRPVEILREEQFALREGNYTKQPTTANPIGVVRSDGIHVRPITITACDFNYYRWPVNPVFVYTIGDGFITYDATNSTEFEYPVDEHYTLVKMILSLVGINLREEAIIQYSESKLKTG
jgi:hypothetical protein